MSDTRLLPVPDALVGERVDAALARMLGMSRAQCAGLVEDGNVLINGVFPSK
ncbi:RNA-binding S4 domain-containing protein, partial [Schaalia turicensis]|uniref:RNA-binding S4 domain-containing protein n=1 Tax=Schaalia turicensis TaxID=131111 RepID=UPI0034A30F3E